MRDKISLIVGGYKVENFISYTIDSDLYVADDAFSLELANPEVTIYKGSRCELYVNDILEMTGIIDKITPSYDKSGNKLRVEGRDLMGLLTDSCCEEFITLQGVTLKALTERLLKKTPFISTKDIVYQENVVGKLKSKKHSKSAAWDTSQNFSQIEPGMTIVEALKEYARSRGVIFWSMPDGTFVFGRPLVSGEPAFRLTNRKDGKENNIKEGEKTEDISKQYSSITVMGQQQGTDATATSSINTKATVANDAVPFYKPFVVKNNNDAQSPKAHGQMLLDKQRQEGFQLRYKVAGHSQNGKNWTINQICHVEDEAPNFNLKDSYLIYGRTFELSKDKGVVTTLRLGYPGVIQ
ncbi:MAG: mu-like prophage tail protein gpP [Nitrospirae bacterium]|nr:MAG: mu-like prophage tail protein gpP [Nitrospirota bacterium]